MAQTDRDRLRVWRTISFIQPHSVKRDSPTASLLLPRITAPGIVVVVAAAAAACAGCATAFKFQQRERENTAHRVTVGRALGPPRRRRATSAPPLMRLGSTPAAGHGWDASGGGGGGDGGSGFASELEADEAR